MKITILGDPHGKISKIKKTDLILCTGDLGNADLIRKYFFKYGLKGLDWQKILSKKQIKKAYEQTINSSIEVINHLGKTNIPVFLVYGNADILDSDIKKLNKGFKLKSLEKEIKKFKNIKVINKKVIEFKGLTIGGLNYFRKDNMLIVKFLSKTKNLDILLTHNPPYKILDLAMPVKKHLGSKILNLYIKSKKPKYLICGHIHEAQGKVKIKNTIVINAGTNKVTLI